MSQQCWPDSLAPGEQCGGFTVSVILVVRRPVLRLHADAGNILSGMTADSQMIVKNLHDLASSADIHLLLN